MTNLLWRLARDLQTPAPIVRRNSFMPQLISFLVMVLAPVAVVSAYNLFFAVHIYESESSVAVRKETPMAESSVGMALGTSSALAVYADSFIVAEYARSREVVEGVMRKIDLNEIYSKGEGDPLYGYDKGSRIEHIVSYWQGMVDADFDSSTGIIKLKVRAFSPEDAQLIAAKLSSLLETLVAKMSEKTLQESVKFAQVNLDQSAKMLTDRRQAMQEFRIKNEIVDPTSEVANLNALITTLSQELIKLKTERAVLSMASSSNPKIAQLDIQIQNTLSTINEIRRGKKDFAYVTKLPELLRDYELLRTNYDIANQQYVRALDDLAQANAAAVLRQAHLYVFVPFSKPQAPIRPNFQWDFLTTLMICLFGWGIYRLIA